MSELSRKDQLGIWFRSFEHMRKIGKVYTLEEIELYTKNNPDKVFIGDIVPSKDDNYLVYNGEKWMYVDDHLNSKVVCEVIPYASINNPLNKKNAPYLNVTCPIINHNETKSTK